MHSAPNEMFDKQEIETVQRKYCSTKRLNPIGYGAFFANEGMKSHVYLSFLAPALSGENIDSVQKCVGVVGV